MRLSLTQIVSAADRAFVGRVATVQSGRDAAGIACTWVTFAVDQALAGRVGKQVTIKQFGASDPLPDGNVMRVPGVPRYVSGEELVVFLSGESQAGFSSPIGLEQGKFPIVRRAGHAVVTATAANAEPLSQMKSAQRIPSAALVEVDLDEFLSTVKALARSRTPQE